MFFGHLPAGYVANDLLQRSGWRKLDRAERRLTAWVMLIGNPVPDFAHIHFYLSGCRGHDSDMLQICQ